MNVFGVRDCLIADYARHALRQGSAGARGHRYLNVFPARKPVDRLKDKVRALTASGYKRVQAGTSERRGTLWSGSISSTEGGSNTSITDPRKCFRDLNRFPYI